MAAQRPIRLLEVGLAGPPETYLAWKLEGLAGRGFDVVVASPVAGSEPWRQLQHVRLVAVSHWEENRLLRAFGGVWDGLRLALQDRKRFARLVRALQQRQQGAPGWAPARLLGGVRDFGRLAALDPDVIHFEWESAAMRHLPLFEVWDRPVVVSCHGAGVNVYPIARASPSLVDDLRTVFERSTAVHCVSEALAMQARRYGLDPDKTWLIRPAVDPEFFSPTGGRDGRVFRVVSIGLLRWLKGWEYGLEAIARTAERGVPIHLDLFGGDPDPAVGEESERERIGHTIADLELESHVRLHGDVSSTEIRDALRNADLLLHPSLSEGIPTVILEAMACGLPIVAADCGGVREAVRDGIDGLVVPTRDANAMADALAALWADPDLRHRMGAAGCERVRSCFRLDRQLDEYEALYRHLATARAEA